ncbi:unnamed protein product [Ceratitis capitata]|uniref:(Mediterranean fruit fly) hypothetical protein n=1 Tax=Ceratitis capitata TaxID=7213 RepID=A0A811V2J2_CERCA|nr:unnamed protein product [Ceratitis capitata]
MIYRELAVKLILCIIISLRWQLCLAQKCKALRGATSIGIYQCQGLQTLSEVEEELTPSWRGFVVLNRKEEFFDLTAQSGEQLEQQQTKWMQITDLDLSHSGALNLDDEGFSAFTSLMHLNISGAQLRGEFSASATIEDANFSFNNIRRVEPDAFAGLTQLEYLNLDSNALTNASVGACSSLRELTLADNDIKKLSSYDFVGLPQLRHLRLTSNSIQSIANGAFQPLSKLIILNLAGNSLRQLSKETFRGLERASLQYLDLSSNDLTTLVAELFAPLGKLQILNLGSNQLSSPTPALFAGLPLLRKLYMYENDMDALLANTFANLTALDTLDVSGNNIQKLDADVFGTTSLPRFRKLLIKTNNMKRFNELTSLDKRLFEPLRHLRKLHLGNNLIEEIPFDVLDIFNELTELLLDNNKLSFLPELNATHFPNLRKFSLEGNPWQCQCLDELFDWLNAKKVEYFRPQSPFFQGEKSLCVVSDQDSCIRDLALVKGVGILEN